MYLKLFIITLIVFAIIDAFWIIFVVKNMYSNHFSELMATKLKIVPAILFYLIYIFGIVYFVVAPNIDSESVLKVMISGALFGLVCYATYDLTSQATFAHWPTIITVSDILWGIVLTASVSTVTYYIYNAIY